MSDEPVPKPDNQPGAGPVLDDKPTDWRMTLPEDLRAHKSLEKFKDFGALARSYIEAEKYIGGAIRIPGPEAKPEEWAALYTKLGRPESPEKYEIVSPGDGVAWDESRATAFFQRAHQLGLTKSQAQGVIDFYAQSVGNVQAFSDQLFEQSVTALKEEWRGAFDRNLDLARRAVKQVGGDEVSALLDETGLGNHPAIVRMFARLGADLVEDTVPSGTGDGLMTPEQARAEIAKVMSDPNDLYHRKFEGHAGHDARVEHVRKLHEIAYNPI